MPKSSVFCILYIFVKYYTKFQAQSQQNALFFLTRLISHREGHEEPRRTTTQINQLLSNLLFVFLSIRQAQDRRELRGKKTFLLFRHGFRGLMRKFAGWWLAPPSHYIPNTNDERLFIGSFSQYPCFSAKKRGCQLKNTQLPQYVNPRMNGYNTTRPDRRRQD